MHIHISERRIYEYLYIFFSHFYLIIVCHRDSRCFGCLPACVLRIRALAVLHRESTKSVLIESIEMQQRMFSTHNYTYTWHTRQRHTAQYDLIELVVMCARCTLLFFSSLSRFRSYCPVAMYSMLVRTC